MATQPLTYQQYQSLPPEQRRRFLRPDEYAALTAEQRVQLGLEPATQGAPIDFGGKVLPNPNGIRPMDDTESPVQPMRLPDGVSLGTQNYQGGAQMDTNNPAPAQVIPPAMQTIGAQTSGVKLDMSTAEPIGGGGVKIDLSTAQPLEGAAPQEERGLVHGLKEFGAQINPMNAVRGIAQATYHPIDTYKADAEKRTEILQKGKEAYAKGNYTEAAAHLLYGMLPFVGPNLERSGEQFQQGDIAGGVGSSVGQGVALAAPEALIKGAPVAIQAVKEAVPAETVAKAARTASDVVNPEITGIFSPRLANAQRAAGKLADVIEKRAAAAKAAEVGPESAAPAAENSAAVASKPAAPPAATSPKAVEQQLNDALGGKPLEKNVPLKQQIPGKLPEGFTPADSTALKGYKYNADAQELETVTATGQRYVHGDVSPEQFQKFEAADSKGKAWNEIRQGSPLTAKYVNGKRIAVKPTEAAADMTSQLQQSVAEVKNGGVTASFAPDQLAKRWGVTEESLTSGREQTRGMSPQDTEASIQALTDAYKQGKPVEPVIEIRDAQNNIVEVDGRARAIAAMRAGVKRIPVKVRRLAQ